MLAVCRCDAESPEHALFVVTRSNEDDRAPAVALWIGPADDARTPIANRKERRVPHVARVR